MATARETIQGAHDALRVTGFGQAQTSAQATYGLTKLNDWLNGIVGYGAAPPLIDHRIDADFDVPPEAHALRLLCTHAGPITITLPDGISERNMPQDGFRLGIVDVTGAAATNNITIARSGWKIAGAAANATISTNSAARLYMFRADLGDWKLAADLGLDDDLPFPADFDQAIKLILADLIGGRFGQELSRRDLERMKDGEAQLRARYVKVRPATLESGVSGIGGRARAPHDYGWRWRAP